MTVKIAIGSIVLAVAISWAGLYFYWSTQYKDRIYPGVTVGSIDLSGATINQANNIIQARVDKLSLSDFSFDYDGQVSVISITPPSPDSASSYPLVTFETSEIVETAFGQPEERTFFKYLTKHLITRTGKKVKPIYNLQEDSLNNQLATLYTEFITKPQNAYFSVKQTPGGKIELVSNPEKTGVTINFEELTNQIRKNLDDLNNSPITVNLINIEPEIRLSDLKGWESEALKLINANSLTLKIDEITSAEIKGKKSWAVPTNQLATWLKIEKTTNRTEVTLDQEKVATFLDEVVSPDINQDVVLPRFEIKDGKVTSWQTGQPGYRLDVTASAAIVSSAFSKGENEIVLITEKITPTSLTNDVDFQIKEIIGTGHSRFSGSPKNRRHNISVGAASLHGLLIKPDEEFSLLEALGEIDGTTGYLTELVIKGDKTVPEYGGGLCQVGTTVFRSALDSGLPITERRNHSYRVSYYEPAGTDATIYDPAPDFRFINDTGNYILIQTRIEGDDLYFDFWGVSDGRIATITDPVIYNIVKPPPTKIIETDSLAPGEKKCTESAHSGADAYFDYTVIYPEHATTTPIKTRRFSSHYMPWQAVCLVGREATSTPIIIGDEATTTPETSASTSSSTALE